MVPASAPPSRIARSGRCVDGRLSEPLTITTIAIAAMVTTSAIPIVASFNASIRSG